MASLFIAGNSWNTDPVTHKSCVGCGPQEQFYGCSDVAIGHFFTYDNVQKPNQVTHGNLDNGGVSSYLTIKQWQEARKRKKKKPVIQRHNPQPAPTINWWWVTQTPKPFTPHPYLKDAPAGVWRIYTPAFHQAYPTTTEQWKLYIGNSGINCLYVYSYKQWLLSTIVLLSILYLL